MPLLFSYGSLQQENVQLATFHRRLDGFHDELVGFELSAITINQPQLVALSGKSQHVTLSISGNPASRVSGMVFEITEAELAAADEYERLASYERIAATLTSGKQAWVYIHAHGARPV